MKWVLKMQKKKKNAQKPGTHNSCSHKKKKGRGKEVEQHFVEYNLEAWSYKIATAIFKTSRDKYHRQGL